jgi:serine/threonine-protein kinase
MDTDHNLLFGVLALQADLIDAAQFIEACKAWSTRKDVPLAELLIERGWITPADQAEVEHHLERKLRKYNHDVRASLAAVADVSVRSALSTVADPDVQRLSSVLTLGESPEELPAVEYVPLTRERYTLTQIHGAGGIGRVWLARDEHLGRDVALKELRPETAENPHCQTRFLKEARITGQLEHPGIVPVYELTRRPENRQPFYTMRFVKGRTLSAAAAAYHEKRMAGKAESLDFAALLNAFVAVCNAVAYAHSRGVIHRDLKGDNILLGDFGEVIVLDWGLAKAVGPSEGDGEVAPVVVAPEDEATRTVQGQVIGTPAYMAPEQAAGRLDLISRWTDVYGLGAVLYEVLTGQPPFSGPTTEETLRRVREESPVRPRQVWAGVPPALEAICLRALAKQPAERYGSARDVAREVQRWLADEPVEEYREPLPVRAARWGRRHKPLVTGAVALLLTAVVALSISTVLIQQQKARADTNFRTAEIQRERAETHFRLAREAVDDYITKVSQDPRLRQHDLEGLRKQLLQSALAFYQKFVQYEAEDREVQTERGKAYQRLAQITGEIGSNSEAVALYQQALALFDQLVHDHPGEPEYRAALATTHYRLAKLYRETTQLDAAEAAFRKAIDIQEQLASEYVTVREYQAELARSWHSLGILHRRYWRDAQAEQAYKKALEIRQELCRDRTAPPGHWYDLLTSYSSLGNLYAEMKNREREAEEAYEKARNLGEKLVQRRPNVPEYESALADAYNSSGNFYERNRRNRRLDQAEAHLKKGLAIREKLARAHPAIADYQERWAHSYLNLGGVYESTKRPGEAAAAYHEALKIAQTLAQIHPSVTSYQDNLVAIYHNLGALYRATNQPDQAETAYREVVGVLEKLARQHPSVSKFAIALGTSYSNLGNAIQANGKPEAALDWYGRAIHGLTAVLKQDEKTGPTKSRLRLAYQGRARALSRLERQAEALQDWEQVLSLSDDRTRDEARAGRAASLAYLGQHGRALAEVKGLKGQARDETDYHSACVYSLASAATRQNSELTEGDRCRLAEQYADQALALLIRARKAGYFKLVDNHDRLRQERALDPLRSREAFQKLQAELETKAQPRAPAK